MLAMDDHRLSRIEAEVDGLHESVQKLNTTTALLEQSVLRMITQQDKRQAWFDKIFMVGMGVFISAFVTWVIQGGLGQ